MHDCSLYSKFRKDYKKGLSATFYALLTKAASHLNLVAFIILYTCMLGFLDPCDFVRHHVHYDSGRASINVTSVLLPCLNGKHNHAKGKKNEQEKKFVSQLSVLIMT